MVGRVRAVERPFSREKGGVGSPPNEGCFHIQDRLVIRDGRGVT